LPQLSVGCPAIRAGSNLTPRGFLHRFGSISYAFGGPAKFVVIKKPATKARKGTNLFTGEPMMFKAKPSRKIGRARPVKAVKDAV
jgi:Bacterial DNA-binding protein